MTSTMSSMNLPPHIVRQIAHILLSDDQRRTLASLTQANRDIRSHAVGLLYENLEWDERLVKVTHRRRLAAVDEDWSDVDTFTGVFRRTKLKDGEEEDPCMPDVLSFVKEDIAAVLGNGFDKANLEELTLDFDMGVWANFDFGLPPVSQEPWPQNQTHGEGAPVVQKPRIKIHCFDDEMYHVPWVAKCLLPDIKVLEVHYTPRTGMPFVSGSFTEHCQSMEHLETLRLVTHLVHPSRLPRNTTSYPLKGSELKDIFRDLHEHMRAFGRLEYECGIDGRLSAEKRSDEVEIPGEYRPIATMRAFMANRRLAGIPKEVNEGGSAPADLDRVTMKQYRKLRIASQRRCCENSRRIDPDDKPNMYATAVIRCKGGDQGLEVKTSKWNDYKKGVRSFDRILNQQANDMAMHGGTWFPEEEGMGQGHGPVMWHGPFPVPPPMMMNMNMNMHVQPPPPPPNEDDGDHMSEGPASSDEWMTDEEDGEADAATDGANANLEEADEDMDVDEDSSDLTSFGSDVD